MKTVNQFDYPTAAATTFKAYKQVKNDKQKNNGKYYQQVIKSSSEQERNRVKMQEQKKKEMSLQEQQNKIREEIERKKREVLELEKIREEALDHERQAEKLAKIKEQQDKIRKIENEQRDREYEANAQFRFKDALRRLEAEKQENSLPERQAQQRRKVNQQTEKIERQQAAKFKDWLKNKEQEEQLQAKEDERRQIELMRSGFGRVGATRAGIDYSKTCLHNPHMVFKEAEEGPNAIERGQSQQQRQQELQFYKQQKQSSQRQRSIQRGQNALQKLMRQREYQSYARQTQQDQINYNLQRIQQGKKNQYIGMKPLTLAQMDANKKLRGEQQFEGLFMGQQKTVCQPASKYLIIQKKHPTEYNEVSRNYSSYYGTSASPYSNPTRYYQQQNQEEIEQELEPRKGISVQPTRIKEMGETRVDEGQPSSLPPHKQELYYSESEEDYSYQ